MSQHELYSHLYTNKSVLMLNVVHFVVLLIRCKYYRFIFCIYVHII